MTIRSVWSDLSNGEVVRLTVLLIMWLERGCSERARKLSSCANRLLDGAAVFILDSACAGYFRADRSLKGDVDGDIDNYYT